MSKRNRKARPWNRWSRTLIHRPHRSAGLWHRRWTGHETGRRLIMCQRKRYPWRHIGSYCPVRRCNEGAGGTFEVAVSHALTGEMAAQIARGREDPAFVRTKAVPKTRQVPTRSTTSRSHCRIRRPAIAQTTTYSISSCRHLAVPFNGARDRGTRDGTCSRWTEEPSLRINYKAVSMSCGRLAPAEVRLSAAVRGPRAGRHPRGSGLGPVRRQIQNPDDIPARTLSECVKLKNEQLSRSQPSSVTFDLTLLLLLGRVHRPHARVLLPNASDTHWHERRHKDADSMIRYRRIAPLSEMAVRIGFLERVLVPVENAAS